jgi:phage baseplate assembly protein W
MNIDFPYQFDHRGRTAETSYEDHIRDMIEQVLFTSPGERVNRPTFGSGLLQLLFAPNSADVAGTHQFRVQLAQQVWLGVLIQVESVLADSEESTLRVTVEYIIRRDQTRQTATFDRQV